MVEPLSRKIWKCHFHSEPGFQKVLERTWIPSYFIEKIPPVRPKVEIHFVLDKISYPDSTVHYRELFRYEVIHL